VYWLARPSYWRWAAATLIIATSLYLELRPTPTVEHPFAATDIAAGTDVTTAHIEWRSVPIGVLSSTTLEGYLLVDLNAGEPFLPSLLGSAPTIPNGWWGLSVPVPTGSVAGSEVRLVVDVRGSPRVVPGVLIRTFEETTIEGTTALVAIPEDEAGAVAAALADGALSVLVGPHG
jgi:SAF domain-containing protein